MGQSRTIILNNGWRVYTPQTGRSLDKNTLYCSNNKIDYVNGNVLYEDKENIIVFFCNHKKCYYCKRWMYD